MIKKIRLTILLLSISLTAFGQELPKEKSKEHKQIEGTNIFMIPPISFKPSSNFKGFQDPDDPTSMIMTMEIPGPFAEATKGFNSETLKTNGMHLKTKNEIKVGGFSGLLLDLDQPANGMIFSKQILIYGNEKFTTLINGIYLKDSRQIGQEINQYNAFFI